MSDEKETIPPEHKGLLRILIRLAHRFSQSQKGKPPEDKPPKKDE